MTLREIALKHGTDKAGGRDNPDNHEFCEAYEFFLAPWRDEPFVMMELGIGGYEYPEKGGEGLRTWREYFPNAVIHGVDLHQKSFTIPGVTIHQCAQDNIGKLREIVKHMVWAPDLIIDDASHNNLLTLVSFRTLFPLLKPGGIYVVEDAHTSYWEKYYDGGWHTLTAMEFFKHQADCINKRHWPGGTKPCPDLPECVEGIESVHFFQEIIFIRKKLST